MKWSAVLFALFILLIIILADVGALGIFGYINRIPYGDKIGHFVLYGILTLLVDLTCIEARPDSDRKRLVMRIALILVLLIGLEEFSQRFFANRTFSLIDLAASYLGVLIFSWAALKIKK